MNMRRCRDVLFAMMGTFFYKEDQRIQIGDEVECQSNLKLGKTQEGEIFPKPIGPKLYPQTYVKVPLKSRDMGSKGKVVDDVKMDPGVLRSPNYCKEEPFQRLGSRHSNAALYAPSPRPIVVVDLNHI